MGFGVSFLSFDISTHIDLYIDSADVIVNVRTELNVTMDKGTKKGSSCYSSDCT